MPIKIVLFTVAVNRCNSKTLAKIYFYNVVTVLAVSYIAYYFGFVDDRIAYRTSGVARHSMGMTYVTIFTGMFYFAVAAWLYIRENKIKITDVVVIILLDLWMNSQTDGRLEFIMTLISVLVAYSYQKYFLKKRWRENTFFAKIFKAGMVFSLLISCMIVLIMTHLYLFNSSKYLWLDTLLTGRLYYSAKAIRDYGYSLFGIYFKMQGWGSLDFDWNFGYFFVDSSYLNYILSYGVVFMSLLMLAYTWAFKQVYEHGKEGRWILIFNTFVAIHGIIISLIFVPMFNPFFVMTYCDALEYQRERKSVVKSHIEYDYGTRKVNLSKS